MTSIRISDTRVVRSRRRRKTIQASLVDGVLEVRIPAWLSKTEEAECVEEMRGRFETEPALDDGALARRARRLARQLDFPRPASVRWVTNQNKRWGSCSPSSGSIRLSHRMARFPSWVIDYTLVHELAHLLEGGHGPEFQALAGRYDRADQAEGFLMGVGTASWDTDESGGCDLVDLAPLPHKPATSVPDHQPPDTVIEAGRLF
jgi:predicted metal-dependent hydrolase